MFRGRSIVSQIASMAFVGTFYICGVVLCLFTAFLLRFDFSLESSDYASFFRILIPAIPIKMSLFLFFGLGYGWWKYASLANVVAIAQAVVLSSLLLTMYLVLVYRFDGIYRSILLLDAMATFLFLCMVGLLPRILVENYVPGRAVGVAFGVRTLILGAGNAGQAVVREIRKESMEIQVVGFLDDDPLKRGMKLQGIDVLGKLEEVLPIVTKKSVSQLIVAIPGASSREMRRIIDLCAPSGIVVKTLPAMSDLIDGKVTIQQIQEVDVKDLLGRRTIDLDVTRIDDLITGKTILVTGAAGSIGSELCRQIEKFAPAKLVMFDSAESPLFFLDREFTNSNVTEIVPVIGNVRQREAVIEVFRLHKPQIVFHAAAYKHVPLMENHPDAAVSVNVLGSKTVADAAHEFKAEAFVMVSTDKAVNPTNVMGATKRCAEMYIQGLGRNSDTRFETVRFGNVLDSAGSVIPVFKQQIENGGPVTVTDPDVTRFFMTIPEATQLVLQAASMGEGGEIFLLDMGEPVKIRYLAEELIRLSGFKPHEDIEIVYSGLRPGEKLYEELLLAGEGVKRTSHDAIRIAAPDNIRVVDFDAKFAELISMTPFDSVEDYRQKLCEVVPEYFEMTSGSALRGGRPEAST